MDPLLEADIVKQFRDDLNAIAPCQQLVHSGERLATEKCGAQAAPDGEVFVMGTDQDGVQVEARKMRCAAGHWYHEVLS